RSCSDYRLLPDGSRDCEPWTAAADRTTEVPLRIAQADAQRPLMGEARKPNRLLGTLFTPADDPSLSPAERVFSTRSCSEYRLLSGEPRDCEPRTAARTRPPISLTSTSSPRRWRSSTRSLGTRRTRRGGGGWASRSPRGC